MLRTVEKAFQLLLVAFAALGFFYVPLAGHTGWQHLSGWLNAGPTPIAPGNLENTLQALGERLTAPTASSLLPGNSGPKTAQEPIPGAVVPTWPASGPKAAPSHTTHPGSSRD